MVRVVHFRLYDNWSLHLKFENNDNLINVADGKNENYIKGRQTRRQYRRTFANIVLNTHLIYGCLL